ncbi:hypothetical protein SERLADRAFT_434451 [Serpula lacrymans var. lacrymans S7.9]|uniref:MT-A70-domain-containing protein n=2 Tax=Serpula lacrymans var. lacrymans TaxID=341189 RepID=F8NL22_SERL9|nr:uncharacterized protein SERLADRAFT_434451 [Serpula lacrymans var. lacrymans S7.9]EGO28530.1 hypothetical protein SERLADRAFT_434451 [Serpula lacrymans var. lacrymans S7.9]
MASTTATTTEVLISAHGALTAHADLVSRVRQSQRNHRRQIRTLPSPPHELLKLPMIPSPPPSPSPSPPSSPSLSPNLGSRTNGQRTDLPPAKRARVAQYRNYIPEEETIRNDYSQRYVDGGEWPQNWVLGAEPERRFEEYPKQQRLLNLKKDSVNTHALLSSYLPFQQLNTLHPNKFDVILLDPPFSSSFSWDELQELPIPSLAADPSFVFMWVGSGAGEGLERGREVLAKWGYRRCEDVVWVKTNRSNNRGPGTDPPTTSLLTRTKQHCLMGIRGTVRRSTDSWFVHCNVDTDVIIWEGDPEDPTRKPPEMYTLIENFCLGMRRLELFGRARSSLRRGWVTILADGEERRLSGGFSRLADEEGVGIPDGARPWDKEAWEEGNKELAVSGGGKCVVPNTQEIEALRPKSPVRSGNLGPSGGGSSGPGMNMGGGVSGGVGVGISSPMSGGVSMGIRPGGQGMGMRPGGMNQNQMMMQPMMGMGMNAMGGMNNLGVGVENMNGMVGWPVNALGLNMTMGAMGMGNMGAGNLNMMGMGMDGMTGGTFHMPNHMQRGGIGWVGSEGQEGGMWEGNLGDGMMMMNGMGMGMSSMGGMPMANMGMGQWNQGSFEGFQ